MVVHAFNPSPGSQGRWISEFSIRQCYPVSKANRTKHLIPAAENLLHMITKPLARVSKC